MAQDFIELFSMLESVDVREPELYKFLKDTHSLIQHGLRDAVPNTLRKFFECFLYRCKVEKNITIHKHDNGSNINIIRTAKALFKNKNFYSENVEPLLDFANEGSHCSDINYGCIKRNEIHQNIKYIITIWNWYVENIRPELKEICLIKSQKFGLPQAITNECNDLKNKLQSKDNQISKLTEENTWLKEKDDSINEDVLEDDIFKTIKSFNEKNIYCTHRTVALFLLGGIIPQTHFCKLDKEPLFKKYSVTKFAEFEYNLAIKNLIFKKKILQIGTYFVVYPENVNFFSKIALILKLKLRINTNRKERSYNAKDKLIKKIQNAIDENKNISVIYVKNMQKMTKEEKDKLKVPRLLKPVIIVPKDKFNEIKEHTLDFSQKYTENLYYLVAEDKNDETITSPKTFVLERIKRIKVVE